MTSQLSTRMKVFILNLNHYRLVGSVMNFTDGDLITINDSSDLSFAIQCSRVLKLIILMNSIDSASTETKLKSILKQSEIVGLKTQLRSIRDQVNKILDSLDTEPVLPPTNVDESKYLKM